MRISHVHFFKRATLPATPLTQEEIDDFSVTCTACDAWTDVTKAQSIKDVTTMFTKSSDVCAEIIGLHADAEKHPFRPLLLLFTSYAPADVKADMLKLLTHDGDELNSEKGQALLGTVALQCDHALKEAKNDRTNATFLAWNSIFTDLVALGIRADTPIDGTDDETLTPTNLARRFSLELGQSSNTTNAE